MAEEESKELPGWVPLFTSLIILMCAFFILLVAYSSFDDTRTKEAIGSLRGTFGISGGLGLFTDRGMLPVERSKEEAKREASESMIEKLRAFKKYCEKRHGIRIRYSSEGIRIDTAERVLFDEGSASLRQESAEFLTMVAELIADAESHAIIEGHCDASEISASGFPSGWALSIERAEAVTNFLIEAGVSPGKLASYGYGEFNPLSAKDGEEKFNRRVTMLIDIGNVEDLVDDEGAEDV
ncbi:MAG: OmpA family protein [Candidatus Coatesbacteria bacterium]|nr:OmpA family protein [Candidatus Coatesbacteria bacterium]